MRRNVCISVHLFTDVDDFHQLASDPENLQFIFLRKLVLKKVNMRLLTTLWNHLWVFRAICDKKTEKLIGAIKFEKLDEIRKEAEIGYFLRKDFWSQGYMTEAVTKLRIYPWRIDIKQLLIVTHLENTASQKVAQKSGFVLSRRFKGSDRYTRKMRDYLEFRYTKGELNE